MINFRKLLKTKFLRVSHFIYIFNGSDEVVRFNMHKLRIERYKPLNLPKDSNYKHYYKATPKDKE